MKRIRKIFPKIKDNKWVSTTTPVYYWVDMDGDLRLTDKSAVVVGCKVNAVYPSIDVIPQDTVDQIIAFNKVPTIQLTLYKEASAYKITDEIKVGKMAVIRQKSYSAQTILTKNDVMRALFGAGKNKKESVAIIKLYDGSQYWEDGAVTKPPPYGNITYYTQWMGGRDQFCGNYYRIVDGQRKLGKYIRESIEVIPEVFPGTGVGIYPMSSRYALDNRFHYTHVGRGTYEQLMAGIYENRFDTVMENGGNNIYNRQLGADYPAEFLKDLKVGVKIGIDAVCVLTENVASKQNYVYTLPPDANMGVIDGVGGLYDAFGQLYDRNLVITETFGSVRTVNEDRKRYLGIIQTFSSNSDEVLYLDFKDDYWGIYCDFNLSDKENFYVTKTKYDRGLMAQGSTLGDLTEDIDILIPKNGNPTIEVILIPAKWRYFVWVLGQYSGSSVSKWNARSFVGTSPGVYGRAGGFFTAWDPGGIEWGDNGLMIFSAWSGANQQPMDYKTYGYLKTPSGRVHGPIYNDALIEDMVFGSLTHRRTLRDSLGQLPVGGGSPGSPERRSYWDPGYSAWKEPNSEGQLVAIIRVLHDNGAVDHRYVYAKKTSTDKPTLRAYASAAHPFGSGAGYPFDPDSGGPGHYGAMEIFNAQDVGYPGLLFLTENNFCGLGVATNQWYSENERTTYRYSIYYGYEILSYSDAQFASLYQLIESYNNPPIAESVVDPYYQDLYKEVSAKYINSIAVENQYVTVHGRVFYAGG